MQEDHDIDPLETKEWLDAFHSLIRHGGSERASYVFQQLGQAAISERIDVPCGITTPYINTISLKDEPPLPGDDAIETRIRSLIRWNAMAMVMRANDNDEGLGGHIASFASAANLYDIGFNHFFHADTKERLGDLIFYQGHSSPGMYARSYLEGRLSEEQLDNFRREVDGNGLSSYPHPWLMPSYWQFPTVSMGLGPINAIYMAHVIRYMNARELIADSPDRKIWAFLGDGECDEPETLGAISLAAREHLDNVIFVINCNLQRLDGPVRGNGKIVQELEGIFRGNGWNVIKVLWGHGWDELLARDKSGLLLKRMNEVCDGELQTFKVNGGAYSRKHFFGKYPELLDLVSHLSDQEIMHLNRGGNDSTKVHAAYAKAVSHKGQPTVILAQTVKGFGMGSAAGESSNETHSIKKVDFENLKNFRDRFKLPFTDEQLKEKPYYRPAADSPEMVYLHQQRKKLGGYLPARRKDFTALDTPKIETFASQLNGTGKREISTTMAFVRILSTLVKDKSIGNFVVPIVPDEARTFGMEGMFRQVGIYAVAGQKYTPHDADQVMFYKEDKKGQILEEGINEAGAMCSWISAATAYSHSNSPMVPFYIFYSMFGFQRIGDLAWLAGDIQARGFLIGATAGRTSLNGEGLQHQDGHSHLMANTIPNCRSYDPAYNYELAVIIQDGMRRMYHKKDNCFYYITTMNENYQHPAIPVGSEEGIIKGLYKLEEGKSKLKNRVQLMGSGTILREIEAAAAILRKDFKVDADVWSMTSVNELAREGQRVTRWNLMHPDQKPKKAYVTEQLETVKGPVIAATDYIKCYVEQLRQFVPRSFSVLGTDGFGRSDTRSKLRHFFEVNRYFIVIAALKALADEGAIAVSTVTEAIKTFEIDTDKLDPMLC